MTSVRKICQRARDRAGALAPALLRRYPAPTERDEHITRGLLHLAEIPTHPTPDALTRIRAKTSGAPLHGDAATHHDDLLGSETPMSIISKPAHALRPGDTITRHPDHPDRRVRLRVIRGACRAVDGVVIDYTAPADELPGLTPNDRASGVLFLAPNQTCEVEPAPAERTKP